MLRLSFAVSPAPLQTHRLLSCVLKPQALGLGHLTLLEYLLLHDSLSTYFFNLARKSSSSLKDSKKAPVAYLFFCYTMNLYHNPVCSTQLGLHWCLQGKKSVTILMWGEELKVVAGLRQLCGSPKNKVIVAIYVQPYFEWGFGGL